MLANPSRKADYGFGVGEFLWYWNGQDDLKTMLYYNKRMGKFSDDGVTLNSAYGRRIRARLDLETMWSASQWDACKKTLIDDPDSRRAILIINRPEDNIIAAYEGSKDVPCTLSLQFFIRRNRLDLHVTMRSSDTFWGLSYDLFTFTLLQECMLLELRREMPALELGTYSHCSGSLHIYEHHFKISSAVVEDYLSKEFQAAAPMEPFDLSELAELSTREKALRTGKVDDIGATQFHGRTRWMAERLQEHRRKRDAE